jgi:type II secretory pathway component HofQ
MRKWTALVCLAAWALLSFGACGNPARSTAVTRVAAATSAGREKIDLELNDIDIYDALRALANKARISLFLDPDLTGTVTINVRSTPWDEVLAMIATDHALRVERLRVKTAAQRAALNISKESSPASPVSPGKDYTGEPIEMRFDDTPIRSAAKTFSDFAKVHIVVDDDVQASVTLHLRNIPWDLALDHLAQKYVLRIVRSGNQIRIARP